MKIAAILHFSMLDYPGKLSAVLFTQGCPLRCVYCHNPKFQDAKLDRNIQFEQVIQFLKTRINLLEGVVFSGGEPLLQPDLYDSIIQIKELGFEIGIHTSGAIYKNFKKILPIVDWVGFDFKTTWNDYFTITQVENNDIKKSFIALINSNVKYEIRTTVDSRFITFDHLTNMAKFLSENKVKEWVLQECILRNYLDRDYQDRYYQDRSYQDNNYLDDYHLDDYHLALPSKDEIDKLSKIIKIKVRRS